MGFFSWERGEAGEDNWFQEEPKEYNWFSEVAEDADEMDDADWNSDDDAPSSVENPPAYPRNPSRRRALAVLSQSPPVATDSRVS